MFATGLIRMTSANVTEQKELKNIQLRIQEDKSYDLNSARPRFNSEFLGMLYRCL